MLSKMLLLRQASSSSPHSTSLVCQPSKVTVKSKFEGPYLPNVLGVGIVVEIQK